MAEVNFFGDPSSFKGKISRMTDDVFMAFFMKKEEQWSLLKNDRLNAYAVFKVEDPNDSYALDALCMKHLYDEKEKRNI